MGINPATLYAHHPSEEHVLAALVAIGHEELPARLTEAARGPGGTDPPSGSPPSCGRTC